MKTPFEYYCKGCDKTFQRDIKTKTSYCATAEMSIKLELVLNQHNIGTWKKEIKKKMLKQHGVADYDQAFFDKEWLSESSGKTTQQAIDDEVQYWDE
jgi:hypothetical protein